MQTFHERLFRWMEQSLAEDIGAGDHSTLSCIPTEAVGRAVLLIKQPCILAGISVAEQIFSFFDPSVQWDQHHFDGNKVNPGDKAFVVTARMHTILQCERLVLNALQRMSGIATLTDRFVKKIEGYSTRILDTRKTTPNFRFLEKEAVRIGGGSNHRMGLYDMIMLKDNHIDYCGGIVPAIERAYAYTQRVDPTLKIEVETRTLQEVKEAVQTGKVDRIMLDNFNTEKLREAVEFIGGRTATEASGGIHLDNICEYAATGVDFISVGALIHQAQSVDMSLKAIK